MQAARFGRAGAFSRVLVAQAARFGRAAIEWLAARRRWVAAAALILLFYGLFWLEVYTSLLQSGVLSTFARQLDYRVAPAPSPTIAFPSRTSSGPFDTERGYSQIPGFARALEARGFRIFEQARLSAGLMFVSRLGIPPPGWDKPLAGLVIRDARSDTLYYAMHRHQVFGRYEDIPPIVTRSLLYLENRQLEDGGISTRNPALDWARLAKASLLWTGRLFGLPLQVEGGSTLAVQLQKYRHSSEGRTHSPAEKLRQIAAASLTAYRTGPNTDAERHEVVLDYINTLPLAATPEYGEISGIMDGLRVWFGLEPVAVWEAIDRAPTVEERAAAYTPVLALLCAGQAPSRYLRKDHAALERRMHAYSRLFEAAGVIDPALARAVRATPLEFAPRPPRPGAPFVVGQKAAYAIRRDLSTMLGVANYYDLNRLDLQVETTLDNALQSSTLKLFRQLGDPSFVATHGLHGKRLLATGDPSRIAYSLLLFEADSSGDRACAHVDNLAAAFDLNTGSKLELGSTAKLRTLAHYLEIVYGLHHEMARLPLSECADRARLARDPITEWAASILAEEPDVYVDALLERSLDRTYSASPNETFWTGGGEHHFHNFDPDDDHRILSIREALVHSSNLVFVRLMRDLVKYHEARLPYDARTVMTDPDDPVRRRMLATASEREARLILWRAFHRDSALTTYERFAQALSARPTPKQAAVLFYVWNPDTSVATLASWLAPRFPGLSGEDVRSLAHEYGTPRFTLLDYAYLSGMDPLELWCLGERLRDPAGSWDQLWSRSADARALCQQWLFEPKRLGAQNLRIRTQIESEAFDSMTVAWRRLGFPFRSLVPSYATALGASGDRPAALAELMGIIVSGGVRRPPVDIERLVFGADTPYHTALIVEPSPEERVLPKAVARAMRAAMAGVIERGTARRLAGVFTASDNTPLPIGGKTGSGDNRFYTYARGGQLVSSRPTSRTATFVFYVGRRHYGVITASVLGPDAADYEFTSALPLSVIKLLAPALEAHLLESGDAEGHGPGRVADGRRRSDREQGSERRRS